MATCLPGGTSSCDLSSGGTSSCDLSSRSDFIMRPVFKERLHHTTTCLQEATSSCDLSSRSDSIYCDLSPASKPNPTFQDLPPSPGWSFCMFYLVVIIICSCCEALSIHIVFLCTFYNSLFCLRSHVFSHGLTYLPVSFSSTILRPNYIPIYSNQVIY